MVSMELNSNPQEQLKATVSNLTLPTSSSKDLPQEQSEWTSQKLISNSQKVSKEEMTSKLSENCLSSSATQSTLQLLKTKDSYPTSRHTQENTDHPYPSCHSDINEYSSLVVT